MKLTFTKSFQKTLGKIKDQKLRRSIAVVVDKTQKAKELTEIPNLKKMAGHNTAYRIRLKSYRFGVYIEQDTVEFAVFAHRKDIYKYFP